MTDQSLIPLPLSVCVAFIKGRRCFAVDVCTVLLPCSLGCAHSLMTQDLWKRTLAPSFGGFWRLRICLPQHCAHKNPGRGYFCKKNMTHLNKFGIFLRHERYWKRIMGFAPGLGSNDVAYRAVCQHRYDRLRGGGSTLASTCIGQWGIMKIKESTWQLLPMECSEIVHEDIKVDIKPQLFVAYVCSVRVCVCVFCLPYVYGMLQKLKR